MNTLIASASGAPIYSIGQHQHQSFTAGDYCVSIEWYSDGRESEPVMVIWPQRGGGALAICLSSIGAYVEPDGSASADGLLRAWKSLPTLGREQTDAETYRLMDVIVRHAPDLILCPPTPMDVRRSDLGGPVWAARVVDGNGKTMREDLI